MQSAMSSGFGFIVLCCLLSITSAAEVMKKSLQEAYLKRFNHMGVRNPDPRLAALQNDPDAQFRMAVRSFQRFAGLRITGEVDDETMNMMQMPRCGVADLLNNMGGVVRRRRRRYTTSGDTWKQTALTYRFPSGYTPDLPQNVTRREMAKAFQLWSDVSPLRFTEVSQLSDIEITFAGTANHGDNAPFDGPGGVLAHAYFPDLGIGGDVHFDDAELFTSETMQGKNLLQIATHELGHSLGLGHSEIQDAIMAPIYRGFKPNVALHPDDIAGIQYLYGRRATAITTKTSSLVPTSSPPTVDTKTPSVVPTSSPPTVDTKTPSVVPTSSPPTIDTKTPSVVPTSSPPTVDTKTPSVVPTSSPPTIDTKTPSVVPTSSPPTVDTKTPSVVPTSSPPTVDTKTPSVVPTSSPPTVDTKTPSVVPTSSPPTVDTKSSVSAFCRNPIFDAIDIVNGSIHVFYGDHYLELDDNNHIRPGFPKLIADTFPGLPSSLDAVLSLESTLTGNVYFFKGTNCYTYDRRRPREIRGPFPVGGIFSTNGALTSVDAAFVWSGNGQIYLIKGDQVYRHYGDPASGRGYTHDPWPLSEWKGLPRPISDAFQHVSNRRTYFFSGTRLYNFNDPEFTVQLIEDTYDWMHCCGVKVKELEAMYLASTAQVVDASFIPLTLAAAGAICLCYIASLPFQKLRIYY